MISTLLVYLFIPLCELETKPVADPIVLTENPQLFLDDHLIAKKQNLKREMQKPARHPRNPLIVQDRPWEKRTLQAFGTVLYDPSIKKFRCWYLASEADTGVPDTPEAPGTAEYTQCYAESNDGIQWKKPNVGTRPFGGHREHNIVLPKAAGFCVLPAPDDPDPQRRYKGLGGNVLGFSPDGILWNMSTDAAKSWADAVKKNDTSSCVVHWKGEYLAYVRFQEPEQSVTDPVAGVEWKGVMRGVGLCVSKDFNTWTPKQSVFKADEKDGYPWTQAYGFCVTPYGDVLIGLLPLVHLKPEQGNNSYGTMDVQMIVSRDGRKWERVSDRTAFFECADDGTTPVEKRPWDTQIYPSTNMFLKDDKVHIYYTGGKTLHGEKRRDPGIQNKPAIGLAMLPADRFVAIRRESSKSEGMLETRSFRSEGKRLLVNAEINPGNLEVEVCDNAGNLVPGFERRQCRLTAHDALRYHVDWESEEQKKTLGDALAIHPPISLRFFLRDGSFYSFCVK